MSEKALQLTHLIYSSSALLDFDTEALHALLDQARKNNATRDLTGMLLYSDGNFFQVLEGDSGTLDEVFAVISRDSRHRNVTVIIKEPIQSRSFDQWSMGFVQADDAELSKIDGLRDFFREGRPFTELRAGRAKKLLEAFVKGRWRAKIAGERP